METGFSTDANKPAEMRLWKGVRSGCRSVPNRALCRPSRTDSVRSIVKKRLLRQMAIWTSEAGAALVVRDHDLSRPRNVAHAYGTEEISH